MAKTKRTSKKSSPKKSTAKKAAAPNQAVENLLRAFQFEGLRRFFNIRQNLVRTLIVLVVFAALYLFKDVFIVAIVNGQPVYRWTVIRELEEQGGRQTLDSLVTETLVRQAVREAGVTVEQAEIDAQLADIESRLAAQGFTMEQALSQEGMTRAELVDQIRLQSAVDQLLASDIEISEAEIDEYIDNNREFLSEDLTEEQLRAQVREQLYSAQASAATQEWIQQLQEEARILYLRDYGGLRF